MKILFPVVDREVNKEVLASGFHDTKEVCIFDSETFACQHMSIDDIGSSMRNLPKALKDLEVTSIISTQIRPLALQIFMRCGLTVYKASGIDVNENIDLFRGGYLDAYSMESSRELLGCGGGSCISCASTSCN